jgi:hypothetical protein
MVVNMCHRYHCKFYLIQTCENVWPHSYHESIGDGVVWWSQALTSCVKLLAHYIQACFYIARSTPSYSHCLFFAIWFWAAIPLLEVIRYVIQSFDTTSQTITRFLTTVHEDNQGALRLAQMEPGRHTPRSKFYANKHHWFRSWLKPNEIELQYIESAQQKADILTKSLSTATFEINRKLSCGW